MKNDTRWNLSQIREAWVKAGVDRRDVIDAGGGHYAQFWPHLPSYLDAWPEEALSDAWTAGLPPPAGSSKLFAKFIAALKAGPHVPSPLPVVDKGDMWFILLAAVRYAMGRRTYATSLVPEIVMRYRTYLDISQIKQIRDEVQKELSRAEALDSTLGDPSDHVNWKEFVVSLVKVVGRCTACEMSGHNTCSMTEGCACCDYTRTTASES